MTRLKNYILPHGWMILLTLVIKFIATIMELFIPRLMEVIIDDKVGTGELSQIFLFGGGMLLCAAVAACGNILSNRFSSFTAGKITLRLRHDLYEKLQNLSARQMDAVTVPSAESRLTSDTYNVNQLLSRIQRMGIRAPILLIGGIIMMLSMDTALSLVLVALLPPISLIVYFVTKKTIPLFTKVQDIQDKVVRVCQENITGIRVIKALSKTDYEKARFNRVNEEHSATALKASTINNLTNPLTNLTLNLGLTLVVVVGAFRVDQGRIESGVIMAFLQYFTMILNATLGITRVFIMWSKGEASANRIADILALPEDMGQLPPDEPEQQPAHIEFRDVTFSYTGVGTNIENLSFRLEHGQTLGILGPTGSGKSTILNLLLRLYDPDRGQVLIGGQDVRSMDYDALRKKFGIVFQNDFVARGTIGDNIRFFRDVKDSALQAAADHAQAAFIAEKEGAMDAQVVSRGNNLSGGQKQRLLIARALAARPEILVLDDASSALDYQTDAMLRKALREHYRDTTTVLVAQRVSSLRHADLILVLNDGQVIGAGDHKHLMETCEEYRHIAQTQMGDGKEAV